jgi:hypothetical protein
MARGTPYFDRAPVADFDTLLEKYGSREFASPFRSTVPLFSLVKDGWPLFREILLQCGLPEEADLHFEYTQDVTRGRGKASHTDLMVCADERSLAIEAKWTEPRYETVAEWLVRGSTEQPLEEKHDGKEITSNREEVMAGWPESIRSRVPGLAPVGDFSNAIYQMVHRAASACERSPRPQLGYLQFKSSDVLSGNSTYWMDLCRLHELLGHPSNFRFHLIEIDVAPTLAFVAIRHLEKGSAATDLAVRDSLLGTLLFEFGSPKIRSL